MLKTNKLFNKLIIGFIFCIVLFTGMALSSEKALAYDTSVVCTWENAGKIECKYNVSEADNSLTGSAIVGAVGMVTGGPVAAVAAVATKYAAVEAINWFENSCKLGAGCDDYFFDPAASQAAGYPVFGGGNTNDNHSGYLHYITNNPLVAYQSDSVQGIKNVPAAEDANWTLVGKYQKALEAAESGKCSLLKTTDCNVQNGDKYTGPGLDTTPFRNQVKELQALAELEDACDTNAPLPFITCPIYGAITKATSNLIGGQGVSGERQGLLIDFLTIEPLKSEEGVNVFQEIVGNVVVVANFFYVIVFLVLIFSSSLPLGLDNYTIKKTLPKFIAAVIMTQFAYVICGVIVDFFNLLGTIVPNMIFALRTISPTLGLPEGNGGAGLQAGLGATLVVGAVGAGALIASVGWIVIFILALLALVAVLVAFVFIVLRMIVLYVLILISPIAFASWVLPGTEKFFSTWWKNFIRLNAMFPLITGMLAVSILLSRVLVASPAGGTAGGAITLVAMIIPIVALLAIPKTLKWTTAGMSALAGGLMGAVAGKVSSSGAAAAKKGTQMAKNKGAEFGKNQALGAVSRAASNGKDSKAAIFLGGKKRAMQEVGKMTSEYRANAANKYAASGDAADIGRQTRASIARSQKNPSDLLARADAQAGLARLNQLGGGGRNEIASAQDAFRNQGGADGAWKGMLGDAGIMGDLDTKAPELTGWGAGAANFTDQITNGETYKVRGSGVDIKGKGAPALGKLGAGSVWNVANSTNKSTQFGDGTAANTGQINWQAAASMAGDTQMHPEDAEAIAAWKEIGRQGVAHWASIGTAAQARGDTAAFDAATANGAHAQTVLTSFGG